MTGNVEIKFKGLSADEALALSTHYADLVANRQPETDHEARWIDRNGMVRSDPFQASSEAAAPGPVGGDYEPAEDANAASVDSAGIPWQADTHSGSRKLTASGAWNLKRGCPDNLAADYRRRFAAGSAAKSTPAVPTPEQLNQQFAPHLVQPAPPAAQGFAPPPPPPPVASVDYGTWYNLYVALSAAGKFEGMDAWITTMNQQCGVSSIGEYQLESNGRARALSYSALMHLQG